jgi:hypothetical protein
VHNIKLWALSWFNIETGLSVDELLNKIVQKLPYCDDSSAIDKNVSLPVRPFFAPLTALKRELDDELRKKDTEIPLSVLWGIFI